MQKFGNDILAAFSLMCGEGGDSEWQRFCRISGITGKLIRASESMGFNWGKILLFDTDVITNFLTKEHDPHSGAALWQAPARLFDMMDEGLIEGRISKQVRALIIKT